MLWFLVAVTLLGVLLLALGLRGRVVGDQPHCRACKFELTGLDLSPAESVCPECAAELAVPKAVRSGLRVRRRGAIILAVVLLIPAGTGVVAAFNWTSWNASKPTGLLLLDGRFGSSAVRHAALLELVARDDLGKLNATDARASNRLIAKRFASSGSDLTFSAHLARAHARGLVDEETWDSARDGIRAHAERWIESSHFPEHYTVIRDAEGRTLGSELMPEIAFADSPFQNGSICYVFRLEHVTADDEPLTLIDHGVWWKKLYPGYGRAETPRLRYKQLGPNWSSSSRISMPDAGPDTVLGLIERDSQTDTLWQAMPVPEDQHWIGSLPPGEHTLESRWLIEAFVSDEFAVNTKVTWPALQASMPLGSFEVQHSETLTILIAGQALLERVLDEPRLSSAKRLVEVERIETYTLDAGSSHWLRILSKDFGVLEGAAMVGHFEIDIGQTRFGAGREKKLSMRPTNGVSMETFPTEGGIPYDGRSDLGETCTLIFVPDLEAAVKAAGPWLSEHGTPMPTVATEIRWENVPITRTEDEDD